VLYVSKVQIFLWRIEIKNTKDMTEKPTIIFISNRFGYGPTITLLQVIRESMGRVDADLVFAGSGICKEAFDFSLSDRVKFIESDERDIDNLRKLLACYKGKKVFLISCLNRLAIQVAKELSIPNALVDFLTWMWNEIPQGYEDTNHYFSNHFGTSNKRPSMIEVPLILGPISERKSYKKEYLLVNIGGTQNHLVPSIPRNYLTLLSYLLNNLKVPTGLKVVVAGGREAICFLKTLSTRPEFRIESLLSSEYISIQHRSKKIISLAGTNSTFMSFIVGVPVVFLLPQLYAHYKLTLFLKERKYITNCQHWDDYMDVPTDINLLTEKDSIFLIEDLAANAITNIKVLAKIMEDLQNMVDIEINIAGQERFISDFGVGGEQIIWNYLSKFWFK